jgi:hypothetical protein
VHPACRASATTRVVRMSNPVSSCKLQVAGGDGGHLERPGVLIPADARGYERADGLGCLHRLCRSSATVLWS